MLPLHLLPESWQASLAQQSIEPIQSGSGGTLVYRLQGTSGLVQFLKIAEGKYVDDLTQEIKRTRWLAAQHINVPNILQVTVRAQMAAVLMSSVDGQPVEDWCGLTEDVINAVASSISRLHSLPVKSCPYNENTRIRLARAQVDISHGQVSPNRFAERNLGLSAQELFNRLSRAAPSIPEDAVVVHGDATFTNILADPMGRIGFVDCGHCGRADRYVDLALLSEQIEDRFGAQWVGPFLEAYGLGSPSLDPPKARFFLDLYELF